MPQDPTFVSVEARRRDAPLRAVGVDGRAATGAVEGLIAKVAAAIRFDEPRPA